MNAHASTPRIVRFCSTWGLAQLQKAQPNCASELWLRGRVSSRLAQGGGSLGNDAYLGA